jgi:hypothetical protein
MEFWKFKISHYVMLNISHFVLHNVVVTSTCLHTSTDAFVECALLPMFRGCFDVSNVKLLHHKISLAFSSVRHYGVGCLTEYFLDRCLTE